MKKFISALVVAASLLSGCVVVPASTPVVAVGYYDPCCGYWTGYGWDFAFYSYGHPYYGHPYYYGPRFVYRGYYPHHH